MFFIRVGKKAVDERLTVVALEIDGEVEVVNPYIAQTSDGSFELNNANAFAHGVYTAKSYKSLYRNIWKSWDVMIEKASKYKATIDYKVGKGDADLEFSIAGQTVAVDFSDKDTSGTFAIGEFDLAIGRQTLNLKPADADKLESLGIAVEKIVLAPAK
ncbi:MAG: hypothetical protein JEZ07_08705 [Phycisphaerae bacterium]|nr:hypothetical protein [Phycisphaerae bacterium]